METRKAPPPKVKLVEEDAYDDYLIPDEDSDDGGLVF